MAGFRSMSRPPATDDAALPTPQPWTDWKTSGGPGGAFGGLFGGGVFQSRGSILGPPPKVGLPSRGDYGGGITTPQLPIPQRKDYGRPSRAGIEEVRQDVRAAREEYANPTESAGFRALMGLGREMTGVQVSERRREAADIAQRRGFAGGTRTTEQAANLDRMKAIANLGFQGVQMVREQAAGMYGHAVSAFSNLVNGYNQAMTESNIAYANDLTRTHIAQAEAALGAAGLNQQSALSYANDLSQARRLQAQLNLEFQKARIDERRYIEGNAAVAAGVLVQMMKLREEQRQFDLSREDTLAQQERGFRTQGIDPVTGRRYGSANPAPAASAPGGAFAGLGGR